MCGADGGVDWTKRLRTLSMGLVCRVSSFRGLSLSDARCLESL